MSKDKEVTKGEFDKFIAEYPREITPTHIRTVPPRVSSEYDTMLSASGKHIARKWPGYITGGSLYLIAEKQV